MAVVASPQNACACGAIAYEHLRSGTYRRGFGSPYQFSLFSCKACGLVRTYPVPSTSLYRDGGPGHAEETDANGPLRPWSLPFAQELLDDPLFAHHRDGRWLEVGANSGDLVGALRSNSVDIVGCDVDTVAVELGRLAGLPLSVADLTEEVPNGPYDVILMVHTLEHVPDASAMLRNLALGLAPGGLLHICVPNFDGLLARAMRDDWAFLVPLQHVWHFTPKTLDSLVSAIPRLVRVHISCRRTLEHPGAPGIKRVVKVGLRVLGERTSKSDEIRATFQAT